MQEVLYFSVWFSSGKLEIYVSFQNGPSIFLRWEKEAYCSSPISKQFLNILFSKTAEYLPIPKAQFHSKQAVLDIWDWTKRSPDWAAVKAPVIPEWQERRCCGEKQALTWAAADVGCWESRLEKQIAFAESYLDNSDLADKLFLIAAVISYLMQAFVVLSTGIW